MRPFSNPSTSRRQQAQEAHLKAIENQKLLMETVQKALDTKLAKALAFPVAQAAARKEVYARFAKQIHSADQAVAASRLLVTDTGRMCCDLGPMSETPGARASLPLMDPLIGDNPKTLPMVEPLD